MSAADGADVCACVGLGAGVGDAAVVGAAVGTSGAGLGDGTALSAPWLETGAAVTVAVADGVAVAVTEGVGVADGVASMGAEMAGATPIAAVRDMASRPAQASRATPPESLLADVRVGMGRIEIMGVLRIGESNWSGLNWAKGQAAARSPPPDRRVIHSTPVVPK